MEVAILVVAIAQLIVGVIGIWLANRRPPRGRHRK